MGLHKGPDEHLFTDYSLDDDVEELSRKKKIKKLLDEKLEKKRLREEFMDDFDELGADFDWEDHEK